MAEEKQTAKEAPKVEAKSSKAAEETPATPSALALAEVGNLDGEDEADPEKAAEHGEKYQAAKKKHRWG